MKKAIFAGVLVLAAAGFAGAETVDTEVFRVDVRGSFGGRVGTASEWVGEPDGSGGRTWDTTSLEDGWTELESSGGDRTPVCVLNGPAVEGGRLGGSTVWGADRVHVVRDDVVVGAGETLTWNLGCVVKFTPGARVCVEEGGSVLAKGAMLADAADDSVGGDTNLDGDGSAPSGSEWWLADTAVGGLVGVEWVGGGTWPKRTYSEGEPYGTLPEPADPASLFGGWFTQPDGAGIRVEPSTPVSSTARTLYAKWIPISVEVAPSSLSLAPAGGRAEISVSANASWTASGGAPWASIVSGQGDGDGTFSVEIAENRSETVRSCTIRVEAASGAAFREIAVIQTGMERVATPLVQPADGTVFEESYQRVIISCATAGARVYYTTDGSEPDENAIPYAGSFNVFETTTVKARAYKDDMLPSGICASRYIRHRTLAEAIDQPLWTVTTDSDRPWTVTDETTHDGTFAARRGACGNDESSRMETTVEGEGEIGFWWKVVCEDDPDGAGWDRLSFYIDGSLKDSIDGDSGWVEASFKIKGEGIHTLAWEYAKDWADETVTEDCGWVDQVTWEPTVADGGVPVAWLDELGLTAGTDSEAAATFDVDGDGLTAAQEYLAGTDPTDPDSLLTMGLRIENGQPIISWFPDLEGARDYRIWAKRNLMDEDWEDVTNVAAPMAAGFQFYRVSVSFLPD
jgi:hypothetical protein